MELRETTINGLKGYKVSRCGKVFGTKGNELSTGNRKYATISVRINGKPRPFRVHQLVANAYLGLDPQDGLAIAHIDGNSRNNDVSNLRVGTVSQVASVVKKETESPKYIRVRKDAYGNTGYSAQIEYRLPNGERKYLCSRTTDKLSQAKEDLKELLRNAPANFKGDGFKHTSKI